MNCVIQSLANTPYIRDHFCGVIDEEGQTVSGPPYLKQINPFNVLGTKGDLAMAFGELS